MREDGTSDVLLHAAELEERCDFAPAVSDFLTTAEQVALLPLIRDKSRLFFWGAFPEAERRCAVFLPEWTMTDPPSSKDPLSKEREELLFSILSREIADLQEDICLLRIIGSGHGSFSHRDVLGSLMGLGIERKKVGDICPISDSEAVAAVSAPLFPFISENLTFVGRDKISVLPVEDPLSFRFFRKYLPLSVTVSSMRLDCIVSAVTGMSRTSASEAILGGSVQITGSVCDNVSKTLFIGDTVAVRGYGKFLISEDGGLTKKSRIRLSVKKYL